MKKTVKKLSINKETVASFDILSADSMVQVNGGAVVETIVIGAATAAAIDFGVAIGNWIISKVKN